MIVLDTNVISELWKHAPSDNVLTWLDAQAIETLYLCAITVAELRYGIALMPEGKRRTVFQTRLETEVLPAFANRVLAFDLKASEAYARLAAQAKANGKVVGKEDGYIAASAITNNMGIATRDTKPFIACGLNVINPWD